jgi:hypothetical protein
MVNAAELNIAPAPSHASTCDPHLPRGWHRLKSPPQPHNDFKKFWPGIGERSPAKGDCALLRRPKASGCSTGHRCFGESDCQFPFRLAPAGATAVDGAQATTAGILPSRAYYPQLPASDPSIPDDEGRQGQQQALPSAARRAARAITSFISVDHALFIAALLVILATIVRL